MTQVFGLVKSQPHSNADLYGGTDMVKAIQGVHPKQNQGLEKEGANEGNLA